MSNDVIKNDSLLRTTTLTAAPVAVAAFDNRTLTRDLLALGTIFFFIACYHIQNPLLIFNTQFGSAFRNATLQPAMVVALIACLIALVVPLWNEAHGKFSPLQIGALVILGGGTLFYAVAILLDVNLAGVVAGVPQSAFTERLTDESPVALLENAMGLVTPLVPVAILAVIFLWQPWRRGQVYTRALNKQAAALFVGVLVLLTWEGLINLFQIQQFLLPKPSVIGAAFIEDYPRLVSIGWNTFQNAFWGFVFGCGAGILTGIVAARFVSFSRALLPIAIGINAVPIIALAPIMNNWFGALNPASKIAIVAILTYFPTMISTVRGLTAVEPMSMELMKTYAAGQMTIFRKLRLPTALPFIFSALKVCTTLAMIGAIVSEYFGGSTAGLGFRIRDDAGLFKYPEAWSAIFIAALYGIFFYLVISALERALMAWHISFRETGR